MRVIVSDHAYDRIRERIGCSKRKIQKLVEKAWASVEPITAKAINPNFDNERVRGEIAYRQLMGQVYIFDYRGPVAVLMTVFSASTATRPRRWKPK